MSSTWVFIILYSAAMCIIVAQALYMLDDDDKRIKAKEEQIISDNEKRLGLNK